MNFIDTDSMTFNVCLKFFTAPARTPLEMTPSEWMAELACFLDGWDGT